MKTPAFKTFAITRHPSIDRDYNRKTHRFADDFLAPATYQLFIDAFPDFEVLNPDDDPEPLPGGPEKQDPVRQGKLNVPADTVGVDYSIRSIDGRFTTSHFNAVRNLQGIIGDPNWESPWQWKVAVPSEGSYDIKVQLRTTSGAEGFTTNRCTIRDYLIVSIGDSAASGQGNPDTPGVPDGFDVPGFEWYNAFIPQELLYRLTREGMNWGWNKIKRGIPIIARAGKLTTKMDKQPLWFEPQAYRSLLGGHAVAARMLERRSEGRVVTFLPFGRTGSTILHGLIGPRNDVDESWIGHIGQIEEASEAVGGRRIDALLVYIGVNDVGVADSLEGLVTGDLALGIPLFSRESVEKIAMENMKELRANLIVLEKAVSEHLNVRHVFLTEYPGALFDSRLGKPSQGCEIFEPGLGTFGLDTADAELIQSLADELNKTLKTFVDNLPKTRNPTWHYVSGIANEFRGHGYCTDSDSLYVTASESLVVQGDTEGTIHPNRDGHQKIGNIVHQAVEESPVFDAPKIWLEPMLSVLMGGM